LFIFSIVHATASIQNYRLGLNYFKDQRFTRASLLLESFIKENPKHPLAYKAQFYRGEALKRSQNYSEAAESFEDVILSFAATDSIKAQALFSMAESYQSIGDQGKAERIITQIMVLYPNSSISRKSQKKYPHLKTKLQRKVREFSR